MAVTKISYAVNLLNLIEKAQNGEKSRVRRLNKRARLPIVRPQTIPA
jgi:hypothetical protein